MFIVVPGIELINQRIKYKINNKENTTKKGRTIGEYITLFETFNVTLLNYFESINKTKEDLITNDDYSKIESSIETSYNKLTDDLNKFQTDTETDNNQQIIKSKKLKRF